MDVDGALRPITPASVATQLRRFGGHGCATLLRHRSPRSTGGARRARPAYRLVLLALFGPIFWPRNPTAIDIGSTLRPPSFAHPMGTDERRP